MLIHNGKGKEMILQVAPVNPLGKDFTCSVDSYRLSTVLSEQVYAVLWFDSICFIKVGVDLVSVFKVLWLYCDQRQEEVKATMYTSQLWHISPARDLFKA